MVNLARVLGPENFIVVVADDWLDGRLPEGLRVAQLPITRPVKSLSGMITYPVRLMRSAMALSKFLRRHQIRCVGINDFYFMEGVIARLLGYRGRMVTWVRVDPARLGQIGRLWLRLSARSSNAIIAVSKFIQATLPDHLPARLIYDVAPEPPVRVRANGQRLLYFGNYTRGKGQDLAIAAFHQLASRFPHAELCFHGSDLGLTKNAEYRAELVEKAKLGAGNGRIHVGPFVSDITAEFSRSLAALNFSSSESFSLTCYEASAHGLPVIATRCGGPEEIIVDGQTGFLVDLDDVAAMSHRMEALLSDPERARTMGQSGARHVARVFKKEPFVAEMSDLLNLHRSAGHSPRRSK